MNKRTQSNNVTHYPLPITITEPKNDFQHFSTTTYIFSITVKPQGTKITTSLQENDKSYTINFLFRTLCLINHKWVMNFAILSLFVVCVVPFCMLK